MKVLLDIKDNKAAFIMELLNNFNFVKAEPLTPYKTNVIRSIKQAVEEMKQIKEGKLQGIPAKDLLDEL
jgi:hypothetical protein